MDGYAMHLPTAKGGVRSRDAADQTDPPPMAGSSPKIANGGSMNTARRTRATSGDASSCVTPIAQPRSWVPVNECG